MAKPPPRLLFSSDEVSATPEWFRPYADRFSGIAGGLHDALSHGLTLGENFMGEIVEVPVTPPDDWAPVTFGAGWAQWVNAAFPACALHKDEDGFVTARGLVDNTGTGDFLFTFTPNSQYSPGKYEILTSNAFMEHGTVIARPDGLMWNSGRKDQWTSVSGLRWRAGDRTPVRWTKPVNVALGRGGRPFPGRPGSVMVLGLWRADGKTTTESITGLGWESYVVDRKAGTTGLRVFRVAGLTPSVAYVVSLLVLSE
jgi:hypothetical protein